MEAFHKIIMEILALIIETQILVITLVEVLDYLAQAKKEVLLDQEDKNFLEILSIQRCI